MVIIKLIKSSIETKFSIHLFQKLQLFDDEKPVFRIGGFPLFAHVAKNKLASLHTAFLFILEDETLENR